MNSEQAYASLLEQSKRISYLSSATGLLSWDQETGMPADALVFRSSQLAFLSGLIHEMCTSRQFEEALKICESEGCPEIEGAKTNLTYWRKDFDRATKIPVRLVEDLERESSLAKSHWASARQNKQFGLFLESLAKLIEIKKEMAHHWGFVDSPYDALLEEYEPGAKASQIKRLFAGLRQAIAELLPEVVRKQSTLSYRPLGGPFPIAKQQLLNERIARAMGFNFSSGRVDTAAHPFCSTISCGDVRLTTRYDEGDFSSSLYGVIHETGHGLYEQGLPAEHYGTPRGSAISLGAHESQSRFWENKIARKRDFWQRWMTEAKTVFGDLLDDFTAEDLYAHVTRVRPSHIRVKSDELTYDLHIMLRFEIELALFEGTLCVADIPAYWNETFEAMMGLPVRSDNEGCLQDIHWSMAAFGYFPTYTLGNLAAAQLYDSCCKAVDPNNYPDVLGWLRNRVHRYGKELGFSEMVEAATGSPLDSRFHLDQLRAKFLD